MFLLSATPSDASYEGLEVGRFACSPRYFWSPRCFSPLSSARRPSPAMALAQPATEFSTLAVHDAVLVVTLNRAKNLNALHPPASRELARVWDWFDAHADLRVAIVRRSSRLFAWVDGAATW